MRFMAHRPEEARPHYWHGRIPIAFVFSAPGTKESNRRRPVAGDTGENLKLALESLSKHLPNRFSSQDRYDYRITNAIDETLSIALGSRRSEGGARQILDKKNIKRVRDEIEGCEVVVLCGKKAQLLAPWLESDMLCLIKVCHVGNKGLNGTYRLKTESGASPEYRRSQRIALWVESVLSQHRAWQGTRTK